MPIVKARVEDGVIVESYVRWGTEPPSHIDDWLTAPLEAGIGWLYDGEMFTPPVE